MSFLKCSPLTFMTLLWISIMFSLILVTFIVVFDITLRYLDSSWPPGTLNVNVHVSLVTFTPVNAVRDIHVFSMTFMFVTFMIWHSFLRLFILIFTLATVKLELIFSLFLLLLCVCVWEFYVIVYDNLGSIAIIILYVISFILLSRK